MGVEEMVFYGCRELGFVNWVFGGCREFGCEFGDFDGCRELGEFTSGDAMGVLSFITVWYTV